MKKPYAKPVMHPIDCASARMGEVRFWIRTGAPTFLNKPLGLDRNIWKAASWGKKRVLAGEPALTTPYVLGVLKSLAASWRAQERWEARFSRRNVGSS